MSFSTDPLPEAIVLVILAGGFIGFIAFQSYLFIVGESSDTGRLLGVVWFSSLLIGILLLGYFRRFHWLEQ